MEAEVTTITAKVFDEMCRVFTWRTNHSKLWSSAVSTTNHVVACLTDSVIQNCVKLHVT